MIRSRAFSSRFSEALAIAALAAALVPASCAASGEMSDADAEMFRQLEQQAVEAAGANKDARSVAAAGNARIDEALQAEGARAGKIASIKQRAADLAASGTDLVFSGKDIDRLEEEGRRKAAAAGAAPVERHPVASNYSTLVFFSWGLGQDAVDEMLRANAGQADTALVLRGLIPGTKDFPGTLAKIAGRIKALGLRDSPPNVVINPVWFTQYGITKVPAVVALVSPTDGASGEPETRKARPKKQELARVFGLGDALWLRGRVSQGGRGSFGVQGPVGEIAERDVIDEMKDRASKVDWEKKRDAAVARAWKNIPIETLEKAPRYRLRVVDPTFTVLRDLKAPDPYHKGRELVIARRGQRINPLSLRPFTKMLVVFDASDPKEAEYVRKSLPGWKKEHGKDDNSTVLIMSGFDRDSGWEGYGKVTQGFGGRPVFALQKELIPSFGLERHPCLVYQGGRDGMGFIVEEFDVPQE